MVYAWHFEAVWQYKDAFARGIAVTLELSLLAIAIALALGTALAIAKCFFPDKRVRTIVAGVIEVLRAFPVIVLIVWFFYACPILTGVRLPPFESALLALSLIASSFMAEIIRAGIEAVPKGQLEAARVLGMSELQIIASIVLPQAFRRNAAAIMGECSTIIKDSSLAVIIGVNELLHVTSNAAVNSYRPMELYTVLGLLFLAIILPLSAASKKLEFKEIMRNRQ